MGMLVFDEVTIDYVVDMLKDLIGYDNKDEVMVIIKTLYSESMDADDWAVDSGYGYCDDCDGERFLDESRV